MSSTFLEFFQIMILANSFQYQLSELRWVKAHQGMASARRNVSLFLVESCI